MCYLEKGKFMHKKKKLKVVVFIGEPNKIYPFLKGSLLGVCEKKGTFLIHGAVSSGEIPEQGNLQILYSVSGRGIKAFKAVQCQGIFISYGSEDPEYIQYQGSQS